MASIGESRYARNPSLESIRSAARWKWQAVLTRAGIDSKYLTKRHGPCPICGGKDRFRFDDKEGSGSFYCNNCGAGDGFKLVQLVSDRPFAETLHLVASVLGFSEHAALVVRPPVKPQAPAPARDEARERRRAALNRVCKGWKDVTKGDPVWTYLTQTRRIPLASTPAALKFHPELDYFEGSVRIKSCPAMVAVVTDGDGKLVTIHRTYLTPEGTKAKVSAPKKIMSPVIRGSTCGGAVRLGEPSNILGLAEGIETALACYAATGIPTWATISASFMPCVSVPPTVEDVVIFADHDQNEAGQRAAYKLAKRLLAEGRRVKLLIPPTPGTDWADVVAGEVA